MKAFFVKLWRKITGKKEQVVHEVKPVEPTQERDNSMFADISHYEICDYSKYPHDLIIFKATEGTSIIDSTLYDNMEKSKHLKTGVYHFYRCNRSPFQQAEHFIGAVGTQYMKDMYIDPIVDFEMANGQDETDLKRNLQNLKSFAVEIYKHTGRKCVIYTSDYLMKYLAFDKTFLDLFNEPWIARYGKEPVNIAPWSKYWAWQFSEDHNVVGIGNCDANYFYKE